MRLLEEDPQSSLILLDKGISSLGEGSQLYSLMPHITEVSVAWPLYASVSAPPISMPPSDEEVSYYLSLLSGKPLAPQIQEPTLAACDNSIKIDDVTQVPINLGPHFHSEIMANPSTLSTSIFHEGEILEGCCELTSHLEDIMVDLPGEISAVPLSDEKIIKELVVVASTIIGKDRYGKMKKTGSSILPRLLSSLHESFRDLKDKERTNIEATPLLQEKEKMYIKFTLTEVMMEASKWVYLYMRNQNQKVVAHPQHIRDIPRDWRLVNAEGPQQCYQTKADYELVADYTGLTMEQVKTLFENERKRNVKKDPQLASKLLGHFPHEITEKLRNWQSQNPGKSQPDASTRKALAQAFKLSQKQIADWFNNHKVGRNRSKKRKCPEKLIPGKSFSLQETTMA